MRKINEAFWLVVVGLSFGCGEVSNPNLEPFRFDPDSSMNGSEDVSRMETESNTDSTLDAGASMPRSDAGTNTPLPNESCGDSRDNDADGQIDEGCTCSAAQTQICYTGPPATKQVGECRDGTQNCSGTPLAWGACQGQVVPLAESDRGCDGLDNDCDGTIDEGLDPATCDSAVPTSCSTVRIQGVNRWETTVEVSKRFYANGATRAVLFALGDGDNPNPDGIVGGALAAKMGGPALGTYHASQSTSLHPSVEKELKRLGTTEVYLIGGDAVIAAGVENQLRNAGYFIKRLAGINRSDTAARVAREMRAPSRAAFIINQGEGSAPLVDGAIVAGLAGKLGYPVLFTKRDSLPSETGAALRDLNITRTYVVGGTSMISSSVLSSLPNPKRISGDDRHATSVAVADQALALGMKTTDVILVAGYKPVDAMAAASAGRIHLLVDASTPLPSEVSSWLGTMKPSTAYLLGGAGLIDASVESAYCTIASP